MAKLTQEQRTQINLLLSRAESNFRADLDNISDWAADEISAYYEQYGGASYADLMDLAKELTQSVNQISDDYYDTVRGIWSQYGVSMPQFNRKDHVTWERVLWKLGHANIDKDFPGYKFKDMMSGKAPFTVDDLWPKLDSMDDMQQFLGDWVQENSRLETRNSIEQDSSRPRWARVPRGAVTCAFCLMLASRGYVYWTQETAGGLGNLYHAHCDCQVVPTWGETKIDGYDPKAYYRIYADAKAHTKNLKGKDAYKRVLVTLRHLHPDAVKDGFYEQSAPWPNDIKHVSDSTWDQILIANADHIPNGWTDAKTKWAVREAVIKPDESKQVTDVARQLQRVIDGLQIVVSLSKGKNNWHVVSAQLR